MRFNLATTLVVALAAETAVASSWFARAPYNKWHETELERWLSDHSIPYPAASERKDLQNLVKDNWQSAVESPYAKWDANQLSSYIKSTGQEVKKGTEQNAEALTEQVKSSWKDTAAQSHSTYGDLRDYVFDSWTHSSLKSFCDRHGIPVPQPRTRDQAYKAAREGYEGAAQKIGETAAYPGNWLYESWSDSDLKQWLDERGITVPQNGKRDKVIAEVRRNAYLARSSGAYYVDQATSTASKSGTSATSAAASAVSSIGSNALDALYDTWSDSQLKEFADKNGIKVPQGSRRQEVLAVLRKNAAKLTGDNISASASSALAAASASGVSAFGAATSKAGNEYARATASVKSGDYVGSARSYANHYYTEAMIALGLQGSYATSVSSYGDSYASTISASASSAYGRATNSAASAKNEL